MSFKITVTETKEVPHVGDETTAPEKMVFTQYLEELDVPAFIRGLNSPEPVRRTRKTRASSKAEPSLGL